MATAPSEDTHSQMRQHGVNGVFNSSNRISTSDTAATFTSRKAMPKRRKLAQIKYPWQPHPFFSFIIRHQLDFPFIFIATFLAPSIFPSFFSSEVTAFTKSFTHLSGATDSSTHSSDPAASILYTKHPHDYRFVTFYTVVNIFLRCFIQTFLFRPIALRRISKRKEDLISRFTEQAWLACYYTGFFTFGMYLAYKSPHWLSTPHFWIDYPHSYITPAFKAYYLVQLSFWLAQLVVLHIEKPRKDYTQYLVHHFITVALISTSYVGNFTRIGNAVFVTMDFSDIFLSTAKCLKYLRFKKLCDSTFVLFVLSWIVSRHGIYLWIVRSIFVDLSSEMLIWDPKNEWYMGWHIWYLYFALFATLKVLIIFWAFMIAKVVIKVLKGMGAEDNRSDDESNDGDDGETETVNQIPIQKQKEE